MPAKTLVTKADLIYGFRRLGPKPWDKVSALMNEGHKLFAFIWRLSGGNILNKVRGVELVIVQARPGTPTEAVQRYVDAVPLA